MGSGPSSTTKSVLQELKDGGASDAEADPEVQVAVARADAALEELLQKVEEPREAPVVAPDTRAVPIPRAEPAPALRTARVLAIEGRRAKIAWRGSAQGVDAVVATEVDRDLVAQASKQRDAVLVECVPGEAPVIVGIVQTRVPDELVIKAGTITIEAERELLMRSGRGAMRIREDGDVEIVGSRIMAASRGLFRLVGRILRLN